MNAEYLLRNENGAIWAYAFKKNGVVSKAGSRKTQEQAAAMVAVGEAIWEVAAETSSARRPSTGESRVSYERDIQTKADRGVLLSPQNWDSAMNRDD